MKKSQIKMIDGTKLMFSVGKWSIYHLGGGYFVIQQMTNTQLLSYTYYNNDIPFGEAIEEVVRYASNHSL